MDEGVLGVVTSGSCGGSERRSGLFFPRDFVIAKGKKRNFQTRDLALVGLWAVTCQGCSHWVFPAVQSYQSKKVFFVNLFIERKYDWENIQK